MLMDANARTGEKIGGERTEDDGVLGAYGRDELNDNGKRLLKFATDNKLTVTNTLFNTRKAASRTLTTASSGIALATSSASTTS